MNILTISDLHAPFHNERSLAFLKGLNRFYKPDVVVCLGDLGDQHGWSRWGRNVEAPGQLAEDAQCLDFCRALYDLFPRVLACIGNHDARLAKSCQRAGVPSRLYRSVPEIYESPRGWKWAEKHVVDGIIFTHGEGFTGQNAALRAAQVMRGSVVIGHIHSWASVQWHCNGVDCVFGMNAGCLIDTTSPAFEYGRNRPNKPVVGTGVVIDGVPHFIPLV